MNKKDLYKLLEELCEKSSKEQIKKFLFSVIEKLLDNQNKEIIELINEAFKDEIQSINLGDLDKTIEKIEEQCFIIAHRLTTIKSCNKIIYMEHGNILENGTHQELMNRKGNYYNLVKNY